MTLIKKSQKLIFLGGLSKFRVPVKMKINKDALRQKPILLPDFQSRTKYAIPPKVSILTHFKLERKTKFVLDESTVLRVENYHINKRKKSNAGRKAKPGPVILENQINMESQKKPYELVCPECVNYDGVSEDTTRGHYVCHECGYVFPDSLVTSASTLISSNGSIPNHTYFKQYSPSTNTNFYSKESWFVNWLLRTQALETLHVEDLSLVERLEKYFKTTRQQLDTISIDDVRDALKHFKLTKYYNNVYLLKQLISKKIDPKFSMEQLQQLIQDQELLCKTWKKINSKSETPQYLFSYRVQLELLVRKNNWPNFMNVYYSGLKNTYKYNEIIRQWIEICSELGWDPKF